MPRLLLLPLPLLPDYLLSDGCVVISYGKRAQSTLTPKSSHGSRYHCFCCPCPGWICDHLFLLICMHSHIHCQTFDPSIDTFLLRGSMLPGRASKRHLLDNISPDGVGVSVKCLSSEICKGVFTHPLLLQPPDVGSTRASVRDRWCYPLPRRGPQHRRRVGDCISYENAIQSPSFWFSEKENLTCKPEETLVHVIVCISNIEGFRAKISLSTQDQGP